jgi:hypothetical protein
VGGQKAIFVLLLAAALAAGSALRLLRLDEQILMGDEWHGLRMLQDHSWGYLASHFGESDHCIPLTLLHKLLDARLGMDEVVARLVPLASGLATVLVLPLLLARRLGADCAGLFALLLAVSPLLTYMSRLSRPYATALLLAWVAVIALHADTQRARKTTATAFVAGTALAVWFLPIVAPFLFGAWLAAGFSRRTLVLGLSGAAAGGALLAPALLVDVAALLEKSARTSVRCSTWTARCRCCSAWDPARWPGRWPWPRSPASSAYGARRASSCACWRPARSCRRSPSRSAGHAR